MAIALAACEPLVDNRGHTTEAEDFKQIIIGQSSPEDVQAILGTPTTKSNFGDEVWYYINARRETLGVFAPKLADHNVTAIQFDAAKRVSNIETYDKGTGKPVQMVEKTTPTEGRHLTVMEQLLGNLGRFGAPGRQPGGGFGGGAMGGPGGGMGR